MEAVHFFISLTWEPLIKGFNDLELLAISVSTVQSTLLQSIVYQFCIVHPLHITFYNFVQFNLFLQITFKLH